MMNQMKILFVDDSPDQRSIFQSSVEVFNDKNQGILFTECVVIDNLKEALSTIDGSFDGAILDLKIDDNEEAGNIIVKQLDESLLRVPVVFVTGYPALVSKHPLIVNTKARGSSTYESDLELIRDIKNTGLTHIMGGRGKIEQTMSEVFVKNLLPQIKTWIVYGKADSSRTEKALLRHTLNHLLQLLDDDEEKCFPEEAFICPPVVSTIKTGSVVKQKSNGTLFVVLNPACDLVVRKTGTSKTDRVLLAEVDRIDIVLSGPLHGITNVEKKKKAAEKILGNNHTDYFHWLPSTGDFSGGFINFRKLITLDKQTFDKDFDAPALQISPTFVKDIVARFSSYYARQGQPDLDFSVFLNQLFPSTES